MRVVQPRGERGSLKWIQRFIEERPGDLKPHGLSPVRWVSPLAGDDYAEYRDAAFLKRIGCGHLGAALKDFWPARGPHWDALGVTDRGPVLVEAKAHLTEFFSPPSKASAASRAKIDAAFAQVRADLGGRTGADWAEVFFQYADLPAHLWVLHQRGIAADLLFVSFIGDAEMGGQGDAEVWHTAFAAAERSRTAADSCAFRPFSSCFPGRRRVASDRRRCVLRLIRSTRVPVLKWRTRSRTLSPMKHASSTDLRKNLSAMMDCVTADREPLLVTRAGGEPVVMISLEDYQAMDETAYLMSNPANARALRDAIERVERGEVVTKTMEDLEAFADE